MQPRAFALRILMVNLVAFDSASGSNQHQLGLMNSWLQMGHQVRMLTPAAGAMPALPEQHRGRVRATPRLAGRLRLPPSLDTLFQLPALILEAWRLRPDVVYSRVNMATFVLVLVARALGLKVAVEHNGWLAKERREAGGSGRLAAFEEWAQIAASRTAHFTRSVTRGMADELVAGGVAPARIISLGNGCDVSQFFPLPRAQALAAFGLEAGRTTIGFIGNMVPWHGLDTAIEGFSIAAKTHPELDLVIFGDGPARASLEALSQRLQPRSRVRFMGAVGLERANLAVNCFDIAILPLTEKRDTAFGYSPIKIRDYAAAGRLVLTGHVPDNTELTGHGWLHTHKADDPLDMARVLDILLARPQEWPQASRAARTYAEQHFAWPVIARVIAARLERL